MSTTVEAVSKDGATFVEELCSEPELAKSVRSNGIPAAAREAGFELSREDVEEAIKGMVLEKDIPDVDTDIFEA